ncbi:hypothetical protein U3Z00_004428, partial [Salmonella enterica]|nr:hypothetical protein [Salmonella enterica]EMA5837913.1 hypothetical protein [Salmonella enterica]EMA6042035.1 hypothetical protein [Salmonella enterica]
WGDGTCISIHWNPVEYFDPTGLSREFDGNMGPGVSEESSCGMHMLENNESPEAITKAMTTRRPPIATGECRASIFAAGGVGLSASVAYNEKTGLSGQGGVPLAAIGARAAATCGLKFRDPKARDLKVGAGFSIGLGIFSVEVSETTTWPELYVGVGPGIGPEAELPYTPNISVPLF